MYCVHRLLPPCVHSSVLLLSVVPEHGPRTPVTVAVTVQGTTLRALVVGSNECGEHDDDAATTTTHVGSMPLAMVPCAQSTVLVFTEDHHIVLLQLALHDVHHKVDRLEIKLVMHSYVPMDALINRPPTLETSDPPLCVSPDGRLAALQSYRGWVHIIHVDRALAGLPLEQVVTPIQLEKAKLAAACFLPLPNASNNDPVFVPVYERPLQTVRGYFVNRKSPLGKPPALVDAIRRWHLPGLPYKVIGLSPLAVPTDPTFTLLNGADTTTHMVYAVNVANASHHIVFSSLIARHVTQRVPNPVVGMVEVGASTHTSGSEVWVLDDVGKLWVSSLAELDGIIKQGDCEERTLTPLQLAGVSAGHGRLARIAATPVALMATGQQPLVALCDGRSVFIIDPHRRHCIRSLLSDGPLIGVCGGPRGSLVTLQGTGKITMWRSAVSSSHSLAHIELEGITAIFPYHPVVHHETGCHSGVVHAFCFVVSQGPHRTRAFVLDLECGALEECDGGQSQVAFFEPNEETIATACTWSPAEGDKHGEDLNAAIVSRSAVVWSCARTGEGGGVRRIASISAQQALGEGTACASAQISHASFPPCSETTSHAVECGVAVCSIGRSIVLVARSSSTLHEPNAGLPISPSPTSMVLDVLNAEVASISFLKMVRGSVSAAAHIASVAWGAFDVHVRKYDVDWTTQSGTATSPPSVVVSTMMTVTLPHFVRTLHFEPTSSPSMGGQMWFLDASGSCYRCCVPSESARDDGGAPLEVDVGNCVLVDSLAFPSVMAVTNMSSINYDSDNVSDSSENHIEAPTVVVLRDQEAEIIAPLRKCGSPSSSDTNPKRGGDAVWFSMNVLLTDSQPPNQSVHDESMTDRKLHCGAAVGALYDGSTHDNVVLLSADNNKLLVNLISFGGGRGAANTESLASNRQVSTLHNVRAKALPSMSDVTDRATLVLPVNILGELGEKAPPTRLQGGAGSVGAHRPAATSGLLVLSDTSRCSVLSVLDGTTLAPRDAMMLGDTEFAIGAHVLPNSDHEAVVLATGICKVAAPSDPTSGRIVIVGVNPLRFRASYTAEREGFHALAVCSQPARQPGEHAPSSAAAENSRCDSHPSCELSEEGGSTLVVGGLPSSVLLLKLVGENLVLVATIPQAMSPISIAVTFPFVSVSSPSGSNIYEIVADVQHKDPIIVEEKAGRIAPSSTSTARSLRSSNHAATLRMVHRCTEPFANGLTHIDISYAPRRFLRCDLNRNACFVALDTPHQTKGEKDSSAPDGGGVVEDGVGGVGLTSSPVIPSTVAMIRLPARVLSTHVTRVKHSAVGFFTATADPSISSVVPVRHVSSFNLNTQVEADFTVQSTAPRIYLACDDGSLFVVCGIPSELSRVLARVEHGVAQSLNAHALLRPMNSKASSRTFGFAPALVPEGEGAAPHETLWWVGGARSSVVSSAAASATRSMVRQTLRLGVVDRGLVEHFLTFDTEQRAASGICEGLRTECSDAVTVDDVVSIIAGLTFLD